MVIVYRKEKDTEILDKIENMLENDSSKVL